MEKGLLRTEPQEKEKPGKISQIINVIKGEPAIPAEVKIFGLGAAETIMDNLSDKIESGDTAISAVPFAIMETARFLGAKVTVEDDAKEKVEELKTENSIIETESQASISEIEKEIERLTRQVERKKLQQEATKETAEVLTKFNLTVMEKAKTVAAFFGFKIGG